MTCSMCTRELIPHERSYSVRCQLCRLAGMEPEFNPVACGRCKDQGFDVVLAVKQHAAIYHQASSRSGQFWCWDTKMMPAGARR